MCPTFHFVAWTDHGLVSVSLQLANRSSLARYWKLNTSLLEIRDFLNQQVQWTFVGEITGNKWWGSLKHRIRDFVTKYCCQLNLDRTKVVKSLGDKFPGWWKGRDSLNVDLARWDLGHEVSECYKGYVVRSRLKRVPNEVVKCNALTHEEQVQRFPFRYIKSIKSLDRHMPRSNR